MMNSEPFDRSRLSAREDAILEAAIDGLTDIQIALKLDITQSTVNSYWVRIRGKLGQLSRTELVALALKSQAQREIEAINQELHALRSESLARTRQDEDYSNSEVYRAALDAMPEAVLICCHQGIIRYANERLAAMFGYKVDELLETPVVALVPKSVRERENRQLLEYMRKPHPLQLGIDSVIYGQRKVGTLFRIILLIDSRPTQAGAICTCVVRDFLAEIETRRQHAFTWN